MGNYMYVLKITATNMVILVVIWKLYGMVEQHDEERIEQSVTAELKHVDVESTQLYVGVCHVR